MDQTLKAFPGSGWFRGDSRNTKGYPWLAHPVSPRKELGTMMGWVWSNPAIFHMNGGNDGQ